MEKIHTKEVVIMIKKLAWNVFKSTGNVNTFLELKQIENIEKQNNNNGINDTFNQKNIGIAENKKLQFTKKDYNFNK